MVRFGIRFALPRQPIRRNGVHVILAGIEMSAYRLAVWRRYLYDVCHTDSDAMTMRTDTTPEELRRRRDDIQRQLAEIGDFRPGSLRAFFRKCGKPGCHCAAEGAPGHGPGWVISRRVGGKTANRGIPADAVEETQALVAEHRRFRRLVKDLTEANEALCQARLEAHIETGKNRSAR